MTTPTARFWEKEYPDIDEMVMVQVTSIDEYGASVALLEYGNCVGMLPLSALSKRRIRSLSKHVKIGRNEVCQVVRVDSEKGYIDVSKQRLVEDAITACIHRHDNYNEVKSMMSHLLAVRKSKKLKLPSNCSLEYLFEHIVWPLNREYGHAYEGLKKLLTEKEAVFEVLTDVDQTVKDELLEHVCLIFLKPIKVRSKLEICCDTFDGVDVIRRVLVESENQVNEWLDAQSISDSSTKRVRGLKQDTLYVVEARTVASPRYMVDVTVLERDIGFNAVKLFNTLVLEEVEKCGGEARIIEEPAIISEKDDKKFQEALMLLDEQTETETA
eukprot:TRINITY_DN2890_c0_g1_i1.p1 TRINITY_DN2890_c0_g1~~TRINITY_DN2890_c0_g1_i1.p1  ORF type:complete len:327 (+),score=107.84 TRINITY_DN2890_c0_g1_i1:128-1108(+)